MNTPSTVSALFLAAITVHATSYSMDENDHKNRKVPLNATRINIVQKKYVHIAPYPDPNENKNRKVLTSNNKHCAHQISYLVHAKSKPTSTIIFDTFWDEVNNQTNSSGRIITKTNVFTTRKPRTLKPEYTYINELIEQKTIDIACCERLFNNFTTLRKHIRKNHKSQDGHYTAQLKDGTAVRYAEPELAASRVVRENYPNFFACPKCKNAVLANAICLKRHYEKCISE